MGLRRGYQLHMWKAGAEETSAVPLTLGKLRLLVDHCRGLLHAQNALERCLTRRDIAAFLLLWESGLRGGDCCPLQGANVRLPDGRLAFPFEEAPPPGSKYLTAFQGTKTEKAAQCDPGQHEVPIDGANQPYSFIWSLWELQQQCASEEVLQPLTVTSYLFRPLEGRLLANRPLTADGAYQRFVGALKAAGLYAGESLHSFRRGRLQSLQAEGLARPELMLHGHIRAESTTRRYLDPTRHFKGSKGRKRLHDATQ